LEDLGKKTWNKEKPAAGAVDAIGQSPAAFRLREKQTGRGRARL
jgi:hypothetical protein